MSLPSKRRTIFVPRELEALVLRDQKEEGRASWSNQITIILMRYYKLDHLKSPPAPITKEAMSAVDATLKEMKSKDVSIGKMARKKKL